MQQHYLEDPREPSWSEMTLVFSSVTPVYSPRPIIPSKVLGDVDVLAWETYLETHWMRLFSAYSLTNMGDILTNYPMSWDSRGLDFPSPSSPEPGVH